MYLVSKCCENLVGDDCQVTVYKWDCEYGEQPTKGHIYICPKCNKPCNVKKEGK